MSGSVSLDQPASHRFEAAEPRVAKSTLGRTAPARPASAIAGRAGGCREQFLPSARVASG